MIDTSNPSFGLDKQQMMHRFEKLIKFSNSMHVCVYHNAKLNIMTLTTVTLVLFTSFPCPVKPAHGISLVQVLIGIPAQIL